MKRPQASDGFLLGFVLNLVLHFQWAIAALILLIACLLLNLPLWIMIVAVLLWVGHAAVSAAILVWGNQCSNVPAGPQKPNLNPYSAKNEDQVMNRQQRAEISKPESTPGEGQIRGWDD